MSVRPPARMEQLGSHWTDFQKLWVFFENSPENSSFIEIWKEQRAPYMQTNIYILITSRPVLLRIITVSDKHRRENQNTHLCSVKFFPNIVPFKRQCGKILYSRTGHRWQYGSCASHADFLRLYTYTSTQNIQYLLLCHCNNGCTNAPETYVIRILTVLSHLLKSYYTIIITINITNDDKHSHLNKSNRRWFYNISLNQLNDCGHSKHRFCSELFLCILYQD
jgi:hypothetical protein